MQSKLKCSSRARRPPSSPPVALDKKIECDQNKLHAQVDNISELEITYTWNAAVARIQRQKACMFLKLSAASCVPGRGFVFFVAGMTGILCCFVLHATFRHVRAYFRGV